MGETLSLCQMPFNWSVQLESRSELTSSDAGALLLRQVLDDSKITDFLRSALKDPRKPERIIHSTTELFRTLVLQPAQGWRDQADVRTLNDDPIFALACSELLAVYAYQLLHTLRCIQERRTRTGWSIGRLREQLLKVAAYIRLHARQVRVSIPKRVARAWTGLERALAQRRRYV